MPLYNNRVSYGAGFYDSDNLTPLPYDKNSYENGYRSRDDSLITTSSTAPLAPPENKYPNRNFNNDNYRWPAEYPSYNKHLVDKSFNEPYRKPYYGSRRNSLEHYYNIPSKSPEMVNPMPLPYNYNYYAHPRFFNQQYPNYYNTKKIKYNNLTYEDKLIAERYPKSFAGFHSFIMILLSLTAIALQIIMIYYQSTYYFVGSGIWVGVYFLLGATLAILIIKKKSYTMYMVTFLIYFLGILLVSTGGLIVVNSIAVYQALNCTISPCTTVDPYGASLIGIGCAIDIWGLIYLLKVHFAINNTPKINFKSQNHF